MCIDAPESTAKSLSSGFFQEGAGITQASVGGVERGLVLCPELKDMFRQTPRFSAGAFFLLQGFLKCPMLKFWRTRIPFLRLTLFRATPCDGPFHSRFFMWCHVALGELDGPIGSQFATLPWHRLLGTRNPMVWTPSAKQPILSHHCSSTFCWAACLPQYV